jgi:hypothetical protein
MAVILSAQTGNFNDPATWVGGIVPTIGDEAQCQTGHFVSITGNESCDLISRVGSTGSFYIYGGATLTANVQSKATTGAAITIPALSSLQATIIGNVTGSTIGAGYAVSNSSNVVLNIIGNVTGGGFSGADGVLINSSSASVNITGNVLGGTASGANGVNISASSGNATLSISGNITGRGGHGVNCQPTSTVNLSVNNSTIQGGTGASIMGISYSSTSALVLTNTNLRGGSSTLTHGINNIGVANITVNGNCTGGSSTGHGLQNASTGTISIFGNCQGGLGASNGVNNGAGATVNIVGNCTGGVLNAIGANNVGVGIISITGSATGGTGGAGILNASTGTISVRRIVGNSYGQGSSGVIAAVGAINSGLGTINFEEIEYGLLGMSPTSGTAFRLKKLSTNTATFNYCDSVGSKTLVDATGGQMPAITDVRFGTAYASGALTGSAYIPAAGSVAFGVPVDATTGTATLTAADVRAAIGMASANLDTQLAAIPTAVTNANAVWDELMSNHTTAGTYGGRVVRSTNANNELQLNAQNHAAANVHQFQAAVIESVAFATSAVTLFTGAMRTELTPELTEIAEVHAIHGLDIANALTVTPTLRSAGAITQAITGDGTTSTIITRV